MALSSEEMSDTLLMVSGVLPILVINLIIALPGGDKWVELYVCPLCEKFKEWHHLLSQVLVLHIGFRCENCRFLAHEMCWGTFFVCCLLTID